MEDKIIYKSINIAGKSFNLILIFIIGYVLLRIPLYFLPYGLLYSTSPLSGIGSYLGVALLSCSVVPFIDGGLNGLAFLTIYSKKINTSRFFSLAKKNFGSFFRISLVVTLISAFLCGSIFPLILKGILPSTTNYGLAYRYSAPVLYILIEILFVFSYPLVIVGFFSSNNLKPIRSSISMVINNIVKIKLVIAILLLKLLICNIVSIIPDDYWICEMLIGSFAVVPLKFFVLIYSYMIINSYFLRELRFDFESLI